MSSPARQSTSADRRVWAGTGRIDTGEDVARVLAAVTTASRSRDRTADLDRVVSRADEVVLAEPDPTRILPVAAELAQIFSLTLAGGARQPVQAQTGPRRCQAVRRRRQGQSRASQPQRRRGWRHE